MQGDWKRREIIPDVKGYPTMFRVETRRGWVHLRSISFGLLIAAGWLTTPLSSRAACWYPLFDGQTLQGWTTLDGKPVTRGWEVVDGMIHLDSSAGRGGQIVTDRDYGDFEFLFEWKISAGGNSGIKYRVRSFNGEMLGCEYQMIDDDEFSGLRPDQLTGALYDLYAPAEPRELHPVGHFNRGRILVQGSRIEHWLNGRLIVAQRSAAHFGKSGSRPANLRNVKDLEPTFGPDHADRSQYGRVVPQPVYSTAATAASLSDGCLGGSPQYSRGRRAVRWATHRRLPVDPPLWANGARHHCGILRAATACTGAGTAEKPFQNRYSAGRGYCRAGVCRVFGSAGASPSRF